MRLLLIVISSIFQSVIIAQDLEVTLTIENQYAEGSQFFFEIFLTRTSHSSNGDLYLGNSDFIITFNAVNFSSPTLAKVGISPGECNFIPTDPVPPNDQITQINYFDNSSTNISGYELIINLNGPTPSDQSTFDTRVAKINNSASTHRLGKFKITGISNPQGTAGLQWKTTGSQRTKVLTLANLPPFLTSEVTNLNAVNPSDAVLPISLVYFRARAIDEIMTELTWQTSYEQNTDHFIIEKKDDLGDWKELAFLPAAGNSNIIKDYRYIDRDPYSGNNFYRLNQLDFDGTSQFSGIEFVFIGSTQKIELFPNPVSDYLFVKDGANLDYEIISRNGLLTRRGKITNGVIHLPDLKKGLYFILIQGQTYRFVKL